MRSLSDGRIHEGAAGHKFDQEISGSLAIRQGHVALVGQGLSIAVYPRDWGFLVKAGMM